MLMFPLWQGHNVMFSFSAEIIITLDTDSNWLYFVVYKDMVELKGHAYHVFVIRGARTPLTSDSSWVNVWLVSGKILPCHFGCSHQPTCSHPLHVILLDLMTSQRLWENLQELDCQNCCTTQVANRICPWSWILSKFVILSLILYSSNRPQFDSC